MDKQERALRARDLLEDEILQEVVERIRSGALHRFEHSAPEDSDARNRAHMQLWALRMLIGEVETIASEYAKP